VQRQESECRELADRHGWDVLEILVDNDISAYSGKRRPAYERLLGAIRSGQVGAIVAWHTDRLYRRSRDLVELIDIANEHKIEIRTVTSGDIDLSTASGRMMARVVAAVNEHEIEHGQERMKLAKADAAARGVYRGSSRPFGFEPDGVTIRESEAAEIRAAARRVLDGEPLMSILRDWVDREMPTSKGGTWAMGALRYVLLRARNAGLIEHHGEIVGPAQWEPILPEHEWQALRIMLTDPGRNSAPGVRTRRWVGSGLYRCGVCADGTTVKIGTNGSASRGTDRGGAYKCRRAAHLHRTALAVDTFVSDSVLGVLSQGDGLPIWEEPGDDVAALRAESTAIQVELEALREALGRREIGLRDFQVASAGMTTSLKEIEEKLRRGAASSPLAGIADAEDVEAAWAAASIERRRAVIDALVVVTLLPARPGRLPGGLYFDPASIVIEQR
jgi:site-specific DNA recombinase